MPLPTSRSCGRGGGAGGEPGPSHCGPAANRLLSALCPLPLPSSCLAGGRQWGRDAGPSYPRQAFILRAHRRPRLVGVGDLGLREQRGIPSEWVMPPCLELSPLPTPFPQEKGRKCLKDTPPPPITRHMYHQASGPQPPAPWDGDTGWRGDPAHPIPPHRLGHLQAWGLSPPWPCCRGAAIKTREAPGETTPLAGISSACWGSLGAITKVTSTLGWPLLTGPPGTAASGRGWGTASVLTFQRAPRISPGWGDPMTKLCQCLAGTSHPGAPVILSGS